MSTSLRDNKFSFTIFYNLKEIKIVFLVLVEPKSVEIIKQNYPQMPFESSADGPAGFCREFILPFIFRPQLSPSFNVVFGFQSAMPYHVFQHIYTLEERKPSALSVIGDIAAMLAIVTERLFYLHHGPLFGQEHIEEPVAAEPHLLVAVAFFWTVAVAAEDTFADVGDGVADGHLSTYKALSFIIMYAIAVGVVPHLVAMLVHPPGGGVGQRAIGYLCHLGHQPFEKCRLRLVVTLRPPHPFALS